MRVCFIIMTMMFCVLSGASAALAKSKSVVVDNDSREIQIQHHMRNLRHDDYLITENSIGKLRNFGSEVIPQLVRIALNKNEDKRYRINALYALGRMEKMAHSSAKLIARMAYEDDEDFQATVAGALGRIGNSDPKILSTLQHLLQSDNEWVRNSALNALKHFRSSRARAVLREFYQQQSEVPLASPDTTQ